MAAPPELPLDDMPLEGDDEFMGEDPMAVEGSELDPQFAADVSEAFPDLDDAQLSALQRAFMGLMVR
jgi:hypothetical protein